MSSSSYGSPSAAVVRVFVVVTLSILILAAAALGLRRLWHPLGELGYTTNGDGVVIAVDADSPAAKAAMQVGDRVDLPSTPPRFRSVVTVQTFVWAPGQIVTFGLIHDGVRRAVTLTAVPQRHQETLRKAFWVIHFAGVMAFVVLGAALVLLKPSLTTWGFFFYCLGFAPVSWGPAFTIFPFPGPYAVFAFFGLMQTLGLVGLLVFALCFLSEPISGWRSTFLRLTPVIFVALAILLAWSEYQTGWLGGSPGELLDRLWLASIALVSLGSLYAFVDTYVRARGTDRQRMRWIVVGFVTALATSFFVNLSYFSAPWPYYVINALLLTQVLVPITIAYAVIRHRIIDVSFVVSRALVYGALTTLLVSIFSIIDWFFADKLKLARLGTIAEVGAAVAVGIWFNGLHKRVDWLIDATLFRRRHAAERQLARNAAALPFASTTRGVAQALLAEPVSMLSLASAAVFRRTGDGRYVRENSLGWDADNITMFDDRDDHLLMLLQAENGPLSLQETTWRSHGIPQGPAQPVLALPIVIRREVAAVAFYGAHLHGEALDQDEIKAIAGMATGAAAAYDHLEAEALRNEVQSLRGLLANAQNTRPA